MAWGSDHKRMSELPKDWDKIRVAVFESQGWRCNWVDADGRCTAVTTDCDHIGSKFDHSRENLRGLCEAHHDIRTSMQGHAARKAKREAAKLPEEKHPGYLR